MKQKNALIFRLLLGAALCNAGCVGGSSSMRRPGGTDPVSPVVVTQIVSSGGGEELDRYFTQGAIQALQGDQPGAIRYYMAALRINPNHAPSLEATARSWEELEEYDSALFYAQRCVQAAPDDAESRRLLAELWTHAGAFDSAAAEYEYVLAAHPNDLQARYVIARTWQNRNPDKALRHFLYIRDNIAEDFNSLTGLYEIYARRRDFAAAADVLHLLLIHNPDDPSLYETLCGLWTGAGNFDSAESVVRQADLNIAEISPLERFVGSELTIAELRLRGAAPLPDNFQRFATSLVEVTANRLADRPKSTYQAGMIALRLGNDPLGDSLLKRAFRSDDLTSIAWTEAARLYLERSAPERLLSVLGEKGAKFSGRGDVPYEMAVAFDRIGQPDSARLYLRRSVEVDPDYAEAWWMLARMEIREEQTGPGINSYERAINADPYNPELLNDYATMLVGSGKLLDEAGKLADRALGIEPENEIFLTTRGRIAFLKKDYDAAVKYLQRAVSAGGATSERLELLGDALKANGKGEEARETYERALRVAAGDGGRELRLKEKIDEK